MTFGVLLAAFVFVALGTPGGQELVRRQTETIVAEVLGADLSAQFGVQKVGFAEDGNLAVEWSDIRLMRTGLPRSRIDSVKVGLRILPLLTGRVLFKTIEVRGARIDLTGYRSMLGATRPGVGAQFAATAPVPTLPRRSAKILQTIEHQLGTLQRVGIERVLLSDIEVLATVGKDDAPVTALLESADFGLSDSRALTASAALRVNGVPVAVTGSADYDAGLSRLQALQLVAGPVPLGELFPAAPATDRTDTRPFGIESAARFGISLASPSTDAARIATMSVDLGPGDLQAGRGHTRLDEIKLRLRYVEGDDAIEIADTSLAFDGVSLGLEGRAVALYDRPVTGEFNGFGFSVQTRDFRSTAASAAPVEASLLVEGRSDIAARSLALSKLALETGGGTLGGTAAWRYGAPEARTELRLAAANLPAANIKAFWPFNLAVNTRRWVLSHLGDEGQVTDGTIVLDLSRDRLGPAFKIGSHPEPTEMDLAFAVAGATSETVGELPRLTDASGTIHTSGGDTMIALAAAKVEGLPDIAVSPSSIAFIRAPEPAVQDIDGQVNLALTGSVPDLLDIAARKPLNALRSLPFKAADTSGEAVVTAELPFLLGDAVPKDQQFGPWSVAVALDETGLKVPFEGRTLAGLKGTLEIRPGAAEGQLKGTIDEIPADIAFTQPFGPASDAKRRLEIDVALGNDETAKLSPVLADIIDGPIGGHLTRDGDEALKGAFDLKAATLKLPWVGWRKGKGVTADLAFDIVPGEEGTRLKNLTLKGDGFSAAGEVSLDKNGMRTARLGEVTLNDGDDVDVVYERVANGFSIRVDGKRFDARPFLNDLKANLGAKAANPATASKKQIDVGIALDTVVGFDNQAIGGFQLNYAGSDGKVAALSIAGATRNGSFTADMSPRGNDRSIRLRAPDAGLLFAFTGIYGRMQGGKVALDLLGTPEKGYRGTLKAEDFTLVDEPRLSSIVGSSPAPNTSSLSQAVGRDLGTERAFFDHASVGIDYGKGGLRVSNGIIRGPVFGSSFSGTVYDSANRIDMAGSFMPAYGVNRIFGAIPLVGQILGNGNEGGLIGITYRLDGAFAAPKLTVNPISAIAPGIFRSIFAYD